MVQRWGNSSHELRILRILKSPSFSKFKKVLEKIEGEMAISGLSCLQSVSTTAPHHQVLWVRVSVRLRNEKQRSRS